MAGQVVPLFHALLCTPASSVALQTHTPHVCISPLITHNPHASPCMHSVPHFEGSPASVSGRGSGSSLVVHMQ